MALRGRRIQNFLEVWWLVASVVVGIWVSSTNFQKSDIGLPQQPPTENSTWVFMILSKNYFFQNTKLKHFSPQIIEFKNQDDSEVLSSDFPGLRDLCSLIDLNSLYSPISLKNFLILLIWSSTAPKWPIMVSFCGKDNQKSKFLLIYGIFSVRGCWGQSMLLFWKLDDESQISKTQDHTDTFKHNLTSIFLSVRPKLLLTFQYEIPCNFKADV